VDANNADQSVSRSFVAVVQGEDVKVSNSGAGVVSAGNDASLRQGGAAIIAAGRSMEVQQGGGQLMVAGGHMNVEQGGGMVMVASRASLKWSYVGVLISGSTELQEGTRVLLSTPQAAALGAALGLVLAVAGRLLSRR
jgi:hypothetical protein